MGALTLGEGALPSASVLEGLPLGHQMTSVFFALSSTPIKNHNIAIIYPPPLVSIGYGKSFEQLISWEKMGSLEDFKKIYFLIFLF
ncbi:MAG TPA: hypothetical protein DCY12_05310 [Candidatus Atribacteria bacterium]|nr:hypothetical protein [Candidatus Atribacteria bacterium]